MTKSAPARDSGAGWSPWATAIALAAVALAPRLVVALALSHEPVWDGHYYDFGARRIAMGLGYSDDAAIGGRVVWHPWCHYPVGYSAFLAAFYRVFGATHVVASVVNAIVGAALAPLTYAFARHSLSEARSRAAGAVVALWPGLVLYSALVMTEQLAALSTLFAFVVGLSFRSRRWGIVLASLCLGLGALVRPQALLCAPFLGMVSIAPGTASDRGTRRALVHAARGAVVASVVVFLPILPWTIRNCRTMDGCALVSTNGGWNLAIGAFPRATGRFETLRSTDGCRVVTGQVQQDRCWFSYGVDQIKAEPGRWLGLMPKKLSYTFDHEAFSVEYLREADPELFPEPRRVALRDALTAMFRALVVAASLGTVALVRRGRGRRTQVAILAFVLAAAVVGLSQDEPTVWPLVPLLSLLPWACLGGRLSVRGAARSGPALLLASALVLTTAAVHAVFFGEDRYHIVVVPALVVLAAGAFRTPGARPAVREPACDLDVVPSGSLPGRGSPMVSSRL